MSSCRTPPFVPPHYHHHQDDPKRHRNISFPITMIQCSSLCCFSLLINITIGVAKDNPMLVLVGRVGAPIGACWCLSEDSSQGRQHRGFHSFSGQHHRHCHHPYHQCHHHHHCHRHHDHHQRHNCHCHHHPDNENEYAITTVLPSLHRFAELPHLMTFT